ncbi:hypothetical protein BDV95DRAFT_613214 [Massariosphaeria phaeospora]|uniref:Uncharacterized protein n=1 Tax=Massariosphaeria phaeospora TaxID=100035 RepID=A0A7C8M1M1_9PLEO|nr:hypothetical protein BDV95DRAFT_613214 [Massariosphaeria phaeospora]
MSFGLDLPTLYGENYRGNFNPQTRNIAEAVICHRTHHCGECAAKPSKSCYEKLHFGYCLAEQTRKDGSIGICGERFQVNSPGGCGTHPYNHGYNRAFKDALRGKKPANEFVGIQKEEPAKEPEKNIPQSYEDYNKLRKVNESNARASRMPKAPTRLKATRLQPAANFKESLLKKKK